MDFRAREPRRPDAAHCVFLFRGLYRDSVPDRVLAAIPEMKVGHALVPIRRGLVPAIRPGDEPALERELETDLEEERFVFPASLAYRSLVHDEEGERARSFRKAVSVRRSQLPAEMDS
ncbi:MAG: hypothetical protein ACRD21_27160, partial [Vicinamibacteria bacterium]